MTVSLGGIVLDEGLRLLGVHDQSGMAGVARPTIGGICIQSTPMSGGKILQLIATRNGSSIRGLFTGAHLTSLAALRDAGAPVELIHHLGTFTVWIPPDGITSEQVAEYSDPGPTDWYVGTITLITVS